MIYLDSAATSLIRPQSVEFAMLDALRTMASPGRGSHKAAMRAAETVFNCRCRAAELFKVDEPEKIIFTFNATHALNIAINSMVKPGSNVLVSGFEHNSVTRPLAAAGAVIDVAGRKLFDREDTLKEFKQKADRADVVVCTHVSNAFGYILPIYEIAEICRNRGKPLIIDASQSAGILDINAAELGAAYIAMPGHKGLMGPQGTGILICHEKPTPLMHGGSGSDSVSQHMPDYMPDGAEAGTHNVCGIAGLNAGIEYVLKTGSGTIAEHEQYLKNLVGEYLSGNRKLEVIMTDGREQSGVLSVRPRYTDCETLAEKLSEKGICVRSGLHCAPLAHKSAGTLESGTVRLSFSPFLGAEEATIAAKTIEACIEQ